MAEIDHIKKVIKTEIVTDELGRKISIRKPPMLTQYRVIEMLGTNSEMYASMCMPLAYITGIDDDNTVGFTTKREMEALIQRLGDEGVQAVMAGVGEHFPSRTPEETKAELKKLSPTP